MGRLLLLLSNFFGSRGARLTCAVLASCASNPGLFQQVIHILHDGEEDAEMVHRLDQLAFSDFFARLKNMRYFSVQMSVRFLGLPLVGLPGISWF